MEEEALAVLRELAGTDSELEGMLRLSSSEWFGVTVLAPVLAEFARLHPRVVVELLTDQRFYSLPRREADLVFRIRPFDEAEVISRRLLRMLTLFLLAVLIRQLRNLPICCPFRVSWWAVSFPLAASSIAALRFAAAQPDLITNAIAIALLTLATVVIVLLLGRTVLGLVKGELRTLSG